MSPVSLAPGNRYELDADALTANTPLKEVHDTANVAWGAYIRV